MKKSFLRTLSVLLCLALLWSASGLSASADTAGDTAGNTPFRLSVTVNGNTATRRGFCWYTPSQCGSEVRLYTLPDRTEAQVTAVTEECEWEGSYMHKVTVSGLQPGTAYAYTVGDGTTWSEEGTFTTDNGDDELNFIAIADVQAGSLENFKKGADTLIAGFRTMPDADFVANLGDFTNDSDNEQWNYYDTAFADLNRTYTLAPIAGNHDGFSVSNWFNNMFCLDTSESVETKDGVNYSFDYSNAHFAVLNTNDIISVSLSQLQWLKNDMNSTDKDWKIVLMHKSPFTLGKDGKWPDALYLQRSLAAVCDMCDVDLVISGHDHMYLRTKPLKGDRVSEDGTAYVLAGTAGSKRYEIRRFLKGYFLTTDKIAMLNVQKGGYGNYWNGTDWSSTRDTNVGGCFNTVSIKGGTLTFNSYILQDLERDENGDALPGQEWVISNTDTYSVTKETGKNKITFTGDNTTSRAEYILGAVPSFLCLACYTLGEWLPKFFAMLPLLVYVYITEDTF